LDSDGEIGGVGENPTAVARKQGVALRRRGSAGRWHRPVVTIAP